MAIAAIAEGSTTAPQVRAYVTGKVMYMCATAIGEFQNIVNTIAGPREQARANFLLRTITPVLDVPSARAMALRETGSVGKNDKIIFGTGDTMGAETLTTDAKFIRGAAAQGVIFNARIFASYPLTGQ